MKASQQQYHNPLLLPAFKKSLKEPVASLVWYLGPNFTAESALEALYSEYKGVASSDIISVFFQLKQLSTEKVQVYAVCLCDVLAMLKIRFPNKFSPDEENWMLQAGSFLEWNPTCEKPSDTYSSKILISEICLSPLSKMKPRT